MIYYFIKVLKVWREYFIQLHHQLTDSPLSKSDVWSATGWVMYSDWGLRASSWVISILTWVTSCHLGVNLSLSLRLGSLLLLRRWVITPAETEVALAAWGVMYLHRGSVLLLLLLHGLPHTWRFLLVYLLHFWLILGWGLLESGCGLVSGLLRLLFVTPSKTEVTITTWSVVKFDWWVISSVFHYVSVFSSLNDI